jgi:DNA (cytosine-5)-methyltransferase 1/tRNA (cytosine38-C5)-methyltransferase
LAFIRTLDIRAIEFFSGLGGWRYAMKGLGTVISAYDISEVANTAYRLNFGESPNTRELATVSLSEIRALNADAWLMSPPCQPFCRMGRGKGLMDARSAAFIHLMDLLIETRPQRLLLENVTGFFESDAFAMLAERLARIGLAWRCFNLCPTQFGVPNRRPRVFVAASASGVLNNRPPSIEPSPIFNYLDAAEDTDLYLSGDIIARHGAGLDIVTVESRRSACFIGGYGKRLVGAGSFLQTERGIRRFSPGEISRLLGYPPDFRFPPDLSLNNQYKLLGNGLNLVVAGWALGQLL